VIKKSPETFDFPPGSALSKEALDLVKAFLNPKPNGRLGYSDPQALRKHPFFQGRDFAQLDKIAPPTLPYKTDYDAPSMDGAGQEWLMSDDGDMYDDADFVEVAPKKKTLTTRHSSHGSSAPGFERFLSPDETVIIDGAVALASYGGFISTRRHMVITDKGRCLLIDTITLTVKEDVTVINAIVTVRSNGRDFDIQTPKRTLRLRDMLGNAERWRDAINKL